MKFTAKMADPMMPGFGVCVDDSDAVLLGIKEHDRVRVKGVGGEMAASAVITENTVEHGFALLTPALMKRVGISDGSEVELFFAPPPASVRTIRKKMDRQKLTQAEIYDVVNDIYQGRLSDIEVSAWLTSLYISGMDTDEIADFANAMVDTGDRIEFGRSPVFDFHSLGGIPGNKITPIVVSICAAAGLLIPKTSSRAISSACGTADFAELFCPVEVSAERLREIGETVGGAFVWGGSMNIAPVDDMVIGVEYPLGINPRPQMYASILGKKLAIGTEYLLVDIPVGPESKVKDMDSAEGVSKMFMELGKRLGMHIECAITDAAQPIGHAIGPALEARECLKVLEGDGHPVSVIEKSCECAGMLLEMGGIANGASVAHEILASGKAHEKFREIVAAQGGNPEVCSDDMPVGAHTAEITAWRQGYVTRISNRTLVSIAKALGAPADKGAGIDVLVKKGAHVDKGDVLMVLYADNEAKLARAKEMAEREKPHAIEGMILKRMPE